MPVDRQGVNSTVTLPHHSDDGNITGLCAISFARRMGWMRRRVCGK